MTFHLGLALGSGELKKPIMTLYFRLGTGEERDLILTLNLDLGSLQRNLLSS